MECVFYSCALLALFATLRFITNTNPMYALLYLIVSILSLSGVFMSVGAYFAGALEVIIYAGAIMVLFIFVVMMLNLRNTQQQEYEWLKPSLWTIFGIVLLLLLLLVMICFLGRESYQYIDSNIIDSKEVAISLFGPYIVTVELSSILLLVGLIVCFHIGHEDHECEN